jgi:hypothetical protein
MAAAADGKGKQEEAEGMDARKDGVAREVIRMEQEAVIPILKPKLHAPRLPYRFVAAARSSRFPPLGFLLRFTSYSLYYYSLPVYVLLVLGLGSEHHCISWPI